MALLIALLLAAPASGHRAKAAHAEALGHMQEAAREYEAAWDEEQAPDLLYRLGIVRRKLKQYAKAREALRAYLREAPLGGLRDEVERQLAKLEVLIEAQSEDYGEGPARRPGRGAAGPPASPGEQRSLAPRGSEQRSLPQRDEVNKVHQPGPAAPAVPGPAPPSPAVAPSSAQPAPIGEQRSLPQSDEVNSVHQPAAGAPVMVVPAAPAATAPPGALLAAAPPAAVAAVVPAASLPAAAGGPRVAPWLLAGAAVVGGAGAYFWWDGSRLSRDLDARFAAGDLFPTDRSSYSRAHNESLAGRLLAVAAVGLLAGAVALW